MTARNAKAAKRAATGLGPSAQSEMIGQSDRNEVIVRNARSEMIGPTAKVAATGIGANATIGVRGELAKRVRNVRIGVVGTIVPDVVTAKGVVPPAPAPVGGIDTKFVVNEDRAKVADAKRANASVQNMAMNAIRAAAIGIAMRAVAQIGIARIGAPIVVRIAGIAPIEVRRIAEAVAAVVAVAKGAVPGTSTTTTAATRAIRNRRVGDMTAAARGVAVAAVAVETAVVAVDGVAVAEAEAAAEPAADARRRKPTAANLGRGRAAIGKNVRIGTVSIAMKGLSSATMNIEQTIP